MNFLAHAYLSFGNKEILIGNMISDFVKGRTQFDFTEGIQKGITLHRRIDEFTDRHNAVKEAKEYFRSDYRLYSGPIIDILFDHYLAIDSLHFLPAGLDQFTKDVYNSLNEYASHLPVRFVPVLAYMQSENWLLNYQYKAGIEKSIRGLVRRSTYLDDSNTAIHLFHQHYNELEECYRRFFEDVKMFAKEQLSLLNS